MIISASRRTDIPAFYSKWFMHRVNEGYCLTVNPFNPEQVRRISLAPTDVDAIVLWTKDARPLLPHLRELDERGYHYYFHYTLTAYPREIQPNVPSLEESIQTFLRLSEHLGAERVIWRYDPIILGNILPPDYHLRHFSQIAERLEGATKRVMVSAVDFYRKTKRRLGALEKGGIRFERNFERSGQFLTLLADLSSSARGHGMQVFSCAESEDYSDQGVLPGKCIDPELVASMTGRMPDTKKDPGQRKACGCVVSKDIGVTDSCLHGCLYCYATKNNRLAKQRHSQHDPLAECLCGHQPLLPRRGKGNVEQLRLIQ